MIRALLRLPQRLETASLDDRVRMSPLELHCEEIRDRLATNSRHQSAFQQPMVLGNSNEGQKDAAPDLRTFDDASKKCLFMQGLDECPAKDASHAFAFLSKGSERRQIAATKLNDHSSRSHSIFSIIVHAKEITSTGDGLLRAGELENRILSTWWALRTSGASARRTNGLVRAESLLNALVDRSSHVTYRESKLTRLLQDP